MNANRLARTAIALMLLGAVVYFGARFAGKAASRVTI